MITLLKTKAGRNPQKSGRPPLSLVQPRYRYPLPESSDLVKFDAVLFGLLVGFDIWLSRPVYHHAAVVHSAAEILCRSLTHQPDEHGNSGTNDLALFRDSFIPLYKRVFRAMNDLLGSSPTVFTALCELGDDRRFAVFERYAATHFAELSAVLRGEVITVQWEDLVAFWEEVGDGSI